MLEINTIYNIIQKFKKLDKNIRQIIILSLGVILLFLGTTILKNMTNKKTFSWDYKKIESAENVLSHGKINNDKYLYWNLKDIVYDYLYTMQDIEFDEQENNKSKVSYMDYYELLTEKYKKYLSRKEYEKVAISFISNFLEEDHIGYKYVEDFVIKAIYEYEDNMYLCVLLDNIDFEERYIGIKLDETKHKFSIFYIE